MWQPMTKVHHLKKKKKNSGAFQFFPVPEFHDPILDDLGNHAHREFPQIEPGEVLI